MSSEWAAGRSRRSSAFEAGSTGTIFSLRHRKNSRPASSRIAIGIATPSPIFAPVDRPLFVAGEMLVFFGGGVVVGEMADVVARVLRVATDYTRSPVSESGGKGVHGKFGVGASSGGAELNEVIAEPAPNAVGNGCGNGSNAELCGPRINAMI